MKTFKDISWNVTEEEYRADPAFSYSTLSTFLREGFSNIEHLFDKKSSPALTFGSMVDTLITDGKEAFDKRFFVATFPDLSEAITNIVQSLFTQFKDYTKSFRDVPDKEILATCDAFNYGKTWNASTRISKIRDQGTIYYNMLCLGEGKEVVSSEMYNDAVRCVEALKTSPATRWYFAEDNPFDGIQRFYQLKFRGDYEGIPVRCMADLIVTDSNNKTIQPCDLKTTGHPEYEFYKSYVKWNYYIQQSLYTYIIKQAIIGTEYEGYTVLPYKFIVVNKTLCRPEVWDVCPSMAEQTEDFTIGDVTFKNWRGIVKELKQCLEPDRTVPPGINEAGTNSIKDWLLKESL